MIENYLQTIGVAVITNGAVLALFVWVFKVIFENSLDRRAKLYELELELQNKKSFHRFSRVFDEQAAVLRELYTQLVELNDKAAALAFTYQLYEEYPELLEDFRMPSSGDPADWQKYFERMQSDRHEDITADSLTQAAYRALKDFRPKRIYISQAMANEVERLINLFIFVGTKFKGVNFRDPQTLEQVLATEVIDAWKRALQASQALFPELEELFRQHLGQRDNAA
jgi:hypothetical protein